MAIFMRAFMTRVQGRTSHWYPHISLWSALCAEWLMEVGLQIWNPNNKKYLWEAKWILSYTPIHMNTQLIFIWTHTYWTRIIFLLIKLPQFSLTPKKKIISNLLNCVWQNFFFPVLFKVKIHSHISWLNLTTWTFPHFPLTLQCKQARDPYVQCCRLRLSSLLLRLLQEMHDKTEI